MDESPGRQQRSSAAASYEAASSFGTPVRQSAPPISHLVTPTPTLVRGVAAAQSSSADEVFSTPASKRTPVGQEASDDEQDCAICLEPLGGENQEHIMHCKHRYHTACLRQMRGHDLGSCPMCRAPITPGWTPAARGPQHPSSPLYIPEGLTMREAIAHRAATARRAVQERIMQNQRAMGRRRQLFADVGTEEVEGRQEDEPSN